MIIVLLGLSAGAHPLFRSAEHLESIERQQISRVFMQEPDRLFQSPLLPQSRSVLLLLLPHPCEHDGGYTSQTEAERVCPVPHTVDIW